MKNPNSKMFGRKNDLNPFDDETGIEFLTTKNDSSLFLFGSHNKKRPHNIVMVSTHQHSSQSVAHHAVTTAAAADFKLACTLHAVNCRDGRLMATY
jgi:Brix domain